MVNYAQGQVFMVGTFVGLFISSKLTLPAIPLLLVVAVVGFLLGVVLERLVFRRLWHNHEVFVVGAIGLAFIAESTARLFFPEDVPFPKIFGREVLSLWGARFQITYVWIVACAFVLVGLLHGFYSFTKYGRALRSVASDAEIAGTVGVNVPRAISITFGLSFGISAVAGVLIGPLYFVSPDMGNMVGLKAFSAAVLGGINSVIGTIFGGIALGVLEGLTAGYVSSEYKDVTAFIVLMVMLIWRPQGIFGAKLLVKV